MTQMTVELLKATLPKALQSSATQEWADKINGIALDPEVAEEVRNNFLSYTKVLQEGKFKTESYLDAVTYVTHKLMGYSNQDAYIRTFPQRYQALVAKGISAKDLSAYVAAYHANKLVNLILEQSIVPSWLLNRDVYQRAINTQFELMTDPDVSAKVRSDAANSILTHLKQPEAQKVELSVGIKNEGGIQDLRATMEQLARQQQELIQRGVPARQVAREKLLSEGSEVLDAEFQPVVVSGPAPVSVPASVPVAAAAPREEQLPVISPGPPAVATGQAVSRPAAPQPAPPSLFSQGQAQTPVLAGGPALGNPGTPLVPAVSLFSPQQQTALSGEGADEATASPGAGTAAASAASLPPSAEAEGAGVDEAAHERVVQSAAVHKPPVSRVSLFDPGTFPIGGDA